MSAFCERCGEKIPDDAVRYLVTVHATADFDGKLPGEGAIEDLEAVMRAIDNKSATEHDHDVYESRGFIMCAPCKKEYMKNPIRQEPKPPITTPEDDGEGRVH